MLQKSHLILFLLGLPLAAAADSVTEQIDAGKAAYEAGEYRKAVEELNFAIADIQEKISEQDRKLLPDPLSGWQAEEAQAQSMAMMGMAGSTLSRTYYRESGEQVTIEVVADSPMIQMFAMMLANPMMLQGDPSTKVFRYKGERGLMKHEPGSQDWEATLLLAGGRILVQVTGTGLQDDGPVKAYLDALDLEKLKSRLAN